ncbi:hypothetical protein TL16_g02059 [Triparma laevis f. inornata]|uniref:Uncharacterized protein n=1 Tax=Triparma laevis f. inornata TaxID=1714386 RepID=A0A9W7DTW0_9STRA|nr:hypothetical protein TL16_g02059 [Triparma laevis f. inornata]
MSSTLPKNTKSSHLPPSSPPIFHPCTLYLPISTASTYLDTTFQWRNCSCFMTLETPRPTSEKNKDDDIDENSDSITLNFYDAPSKETQLYNWNLFNNMEREYDNREKSERSTTSIRHVISPHGRQNPPPTFSPPPLPQKSTRSTPSKPYSTLSLHPPLLPPNLKPLAMIEMKEDDYIVCGNGVGICVIDGIGILGIKGSALKKIISLIKPRKSKSSTSQQTDVEISPLEKSDNEMGLLKSQILQLITDSEFKKVIEQVRQVVSRDEDVRRMLWSIWGIELIRR